MVNSNELSYAHTPNFPSPATGNPEVFRPGAPRGARVASAIASKSAPFEPKARVDTSSETPLEFPTVARSDFAVRESLRAAFAAEEANASPLGPFIEEDARVRVWA